MKDLFGTTNQLALLSGKCKICERMFIQENKEILWCSPTCEAQYKIQNSRDLVALQTLESIDFKINEIIANILDPKMKSLEFRSKLISINTEKINEIKDKVIKLERENESLRKTMGRMMKLITY